MTRQGMYLSEMVGRLGYNYTENLKKWMQGILKDKNDFYSKYVVAKKPDFKVKDNAEVLIGNLCVIYAFKKIFSKNSKKTGDKDFRPYKDLGSGDYKYNIEKNAHKMRKKLINAREALTNTMANLDKFFAAVQSHDSIDITEQSLTELMANVKTVEGIYDFNPTELSCVIELSELRADIAKTPDNPVLYRKMAEFLHEMELLEDSLDQIEECLELSPDDGVAWAIKAKVLLDQLAKKRNAWKLCSRVPGSSPYASAMTASAIEWMFTEDQGGYDTDKELRWEFVDSALKALEFWPQRKLIIPCAELCEDEAECPNEYLCKEPLYSTDHLPDCDTAISREWMFFHFVQNIKTDEMARLESVSRLLEIMASFRSTEDPNAFPNLRFIKNSPDAEEQIAFLQKLTLLMKEISPEEHNAFLNAFAQDFKEAKGHAYRNLETLTDSPIADALWDHLGPKEYSQMHKLLWKYVKESEDETHFVAIASQALRMIFAPLEKPIRMFIQYDQKFMLQHWNDDWGPKFPDHTHEEMDCAFSQGIIEAHACLGSLEGTIDCDLLFRTDSAEALPYSYRSMVPLIGLIEYNLTGNPKAKETLDILTTNPSIAKFDFGWGGVLVMKMFEEFWNHPKAHPDSPKPMDFFKAIQPFCK